MNKKALVEAALFISAKPLSAKDLANIINSSEEEVIKLVQQLEKDLASEERGVHIIRMGDKFKMYVKPEYIKFVRHLTPYSDMKKAHLRVLALVAYKQKITQAEIVKIIGNRTYEYVRELEQRGLIKSLKQGRTKVLVPTKVFAEYFGLKSPEEVKKFFEGVMNENKRNDESGS